MGPQVQPKCFRHPQHMRNNWELRKRGYLIRFGHTEALLLKKKDIKRPFFPPCRNWPICIGIKDHIYKTIVDTCIMHPCIIHTCIRVKDHKYVYIFMILDPDACMYDAWMHDACIHNSFIYMILDPDAYGSVSAGREKWPFNVLFF